MRVKLYRSVYSRRLPTLDFLLFNENESYEVANYLENAYNLRKSFTV